MDKKQKTGALSVFAASVLFSIGGLCVKLIPWSGLAINGARNLIGSVIIGAFLLLSHHPLKRSRPVFAGALSVMGVTTLFTLANKMTTAANAIVLQFTAPVFVIIFMLVIFKKKPEKLDIITCVPVLAGIVIFFIDGLAEGNWPGNLIAVLAGVCYAGVFMMNAADGADPLSSTFFGQLACGIVFTPFCFAETDFSPVPLISLAALGVLQVGLAYIFLSIGIKHTPPVTASLITGLEPVMNPLWTAVFYGETVSPAALCGAVLVVGSIVTYNVIRAKKGKA